MFRQQVADLLHAVDEARREFGCAKVTAHGVRQLPSEFIPALLVNGFVVRRLPLIFSAPPARPARTFRFPHFRFFPTILP